MCDAAKEWLGYEDRRQPNWFRESEVDLKPLFAERNRMHNVWISNGRAGWRALRLVGLVNGRAASMSQASTVVRDVVCELCSRSFRRETDKQRHKCLDEIQKPVCEQRGATQVHSARGGLGAEGASSP